MTTEPMDSSGPSGAAGPPLGFSGNLPLNFWGNVIQTYSTQILTAIIGLTANVLLARYLGPEGRGDYGAAFALMSICIHFGHLGLATTNQYLAARDKLRVPALHGNSLVVSVISSVVIGGILWLLYSLQHSDTTAHDGLFMLALLGIPLSISFLLQQSLLLGVHRFNAYNGIELGYKLFGLLFLMLIFFCGYADTFNAFAVAISAIFVGSLAAFVVLQWEGGLPGFSWALFRCNLGFGSRTYGMLVLNYLVLRTDILLVRYFLGAKDAGAYSLANSLAEFSGLLPFAAATILFPQLSAQPDIQGRLRTTWRIVAMVGAVMAPVLLLGAWISPWLIPFLFGQAFQPAVSAFLLLLPGLFLMSMEVIAAQFLNSIEIPIELIYVWVVCAAFNILSDLWVIPHYGIQGAAIVCSATYLLLFLGVVFLVRKKGAALLIREGQSQ